MAVYSNRYGTQYAVRQLRLMVISALIIPFYGPDSISTLMHSKELKDDRKNGASVHWLTNKDVKKFPQIEFEDLKIFCYHGKVVDKFWPIPTDLGSNFTWLANLISQLLSITSFWKSVEMRLHIKNDNFNVYVANNVSMVLNMHKDHQTTWFYSSWPGKTNNLKISPFENTCAGVLTREPFRISLQKYQINFSQVLMTAFGIVLFYYAPLLCRNAAFHYMTGMGLGVVFSLLLVAYFIQRRFGHGYWAMATYTLSMYFLTSIWFNIKTNLFENQTYVLGYLVASAAISFAICYRMGPVENPRSVNLIQWTVQLFSLALIYISSYQRMTSSLLAGMILFWAITPHKIKSKVKRIISSLNILSHYHTTRQPQQIRLLSEEEYLSQSRVETEKALASLREFCQSPKCNSWKITSRLESPSRFAEFVQGSNHITANEVLEYSQVDFEDDFLSNSRNNGYHSDNTDDDSTDIIEL